MRAAVSRFCPDFGGLGPLDPPWPELLARYARLGVDEVEPPSLDDGDLAGRVEIEVLCGGLNFSDLNTVFAGAVGLGGLSGRVFGSEIAGLATRVGPGVAGIAAGDLVVTVPRARCGRCAHCRRGGRQPLCSAHGPVTRGGFQDRLVLPAAGIRTVPAGVSALAAAASAFAGTLARDLVVDRLKLAAGETLALTAANSATGSFAAQFARAAGARVVGLVRRPQLVRICEQQGLRTYSYDATAEPAALARRILRDAGSGGFDTVLDLAADFYGPLSADLLRVGGRYLACGLTGGGRSSAALPWRQIVEREIQLAGAGSSGCGSFGPLMAELAARRLEPRLTAFEVEDIAEACHHAWWGGRRCGKVVVLFASEERCRRVGRSPCREVA